MSFLNSVLKSIGDDSIGQHDHTASAIKSQPAPASQINVRQTNTSTTVKSTQPVNNKRKQDNLLEGRANKVSRTDQTSTSDTGPRKVNSLPARSTTTQELSRSKSSVPRAEVSGARQNGSTLSAASTTSDIVKSNLELQKKEPKKGSYAEIMARAQANQGKPQAVGLISHKPKEKIAISHKKELKLQKQATRDRKLGRLSKDATPPSSSDGRKGKKDQGKSSNKVPQPTYLGTLKPSPRPQPSYKGTLQSATADKLPKPRHGSRSGKRRIDQYAATDDELDDDEPDEQAEEYGYDSEVSDDMEAGFSDVEEEESAATKAAKLEDQKEAELEARLKREKEDKRRKLEALAKKAKPQRY